MTTTTSSRSTTGRVSRRGLTVAAAVLAAVIVWLIAVPVAGIDLLVRPGGGATQQVGVGSVVAVSLLAALLGWGLLAMLERLLPARARTVWTVAAGVVLVLSLAGPLTGGTTPAVAATLALMHLAVGAVLIIGLPRRTVRRAAWE
jgi:hypothetical protein